MLWLFLGAGCAQAPRLLAADRLPQDDLFPPPSRAIDADDLFTMTPEMRRFADTALSKPASWRDRRQALIDALYRDGSLQLGYDAARTRNAAQAFEARAGNCLSLVVMTAAFAKYLGLPVAYQSVLVDDEYSRSGDLTFVSGHINIVLGRHGPSFHNPDAQWLTIDFLPQDQLRGQHTVSLEEHTVVAMYLNNRAAEALTQGRFEDAYWWAREAVRRDPGFVAAANTLGVVYLRAGHGAFAEEAFRYVLERDRRNTSALSNLVRLLQASGRNDEAEAEAQRLADLQPTPPFWHLERGREALLRGEPRLARDLLQRELRLQPYQHEVHFWLAQAYAALGDAAATTRHLALAAEHSPTRRERDLYSAKLERLRATRHQ
jgi:tetratricopeptide (TPR) repeat protein